MRAIITLTFFIDSQQAMNENPRMLVDFSWKKYSKTMLVQMLANMLTRFAGAFIKCIRPDRR